ncbi:MAG: hypothetical protein JXX28_17330 [Deltaproteobacteria bacterium]|nr:hypothetical protein [Deltaproteobacteria bacterium]
MSSDKRSVKELFRSWRQGDAEAGGQMAQIFSDWYYAIATSRLGEKAAQAPIAAVSQRFAQGVVQITEARALVEWAHGLLDEELRGVAIQTPPPDERSQYTAKKRPKALLREARAALPKEVELLEVCYSQPDSAKVEQLATPFGGFPIGVLKARYTVKKWLVDNASVPFQVAPAEPILDWGPLPLYESQRMASDAERVSFEQWMLTDVTLCRDIAEFAHFSIALRDGLGADPEVMTAPPKEDLVARSGASNASKAAMGGVAVVGVGVVFVVLLVIVAVIALFVL